MEVLTIPVEVLLPAETHQVPHEVSFFLSSFAESCGGFLLSDGTQGDDL